MSVLRPETRNAEQARLRAEALFLYVRGGLSASDRERHARDAERPERIRAVATGVQVWRRRRWFVL